MGGCLRTVAVLGAYLEPSEVLDFEAAPIRDFVNANLLPVSGTLERARRAFEFVRDEVSHSWDIQSRRVTKNATTVLEYREGICYAKSHLLASLLRAVRIPSGMTYQRLRLDHTPHGEAPAFCVHALNTVYIDDLARWIRVDARGNKPGINAQFSTGDERLAFSVAREGEIDYLMNLPQPHPMILECLDRATDAIEMSLHQLPANLSS
jgi:transglutaminase-like putative cysteine protease